MTPRRRPLRILAILAVLGLAGFAAWRLVFTPPDLPPGVIAVSGRIEGDDAAIAAKTAGRIRQITVREGDRVEAGHVIAVLDDEQIRAREQQAAASVRQAEARVRLAQHQITVLNEQLRQSQLGVDQARGDAQGRVSEAEGRLAAAEAQLAQAEAAYAQAKWDREAMARLFEKGLIAEQEAERARRNEEVQAAVVAASRRQVDAAGGTLMAARANLTNQVPAELRAARKRWVLDFAGLGGRGGTLTRSLPGGWKQRVAFGAAIMHEPRVLFLDEPTSGVDPIARRAFWAMINQLADQGTAILVTTHYLEEAEQCNRLGFMVAGELVAEGTPSGVKAAQGGRVLEVRADAPQGAVSVLKGEMEPWRVSLFGDRLHVLVEDDAQAAAREVAAQLEHAGIRVLEMREQDYSLEDVFLVIAARGARAEARGVLA